MPHPRLAMPMWEGGGHLARDYSGLGNNATFYNEAYWTAEGAGFDGTNDYLRSPHSASIDFADEDFAVSVRFKTSTAKTRNYIFSKNYGGAGVTWYGASVYTGAPPKITVFIDDGTTNSQVATTDDYNDGEWHDFMFVRDTTANKIIAYIDGEWNAEGPDNSGSIANTGTLTIGGRNDLDVDRFFGGDLKLFTIYDVAPTERQVKFQHDNPYFMYQIPEELYGYVAGAPPVGAIMNQFQKANIGADLYNGAIIA